MVNILTEEKFRKLASLDKKKASLMWQFYLSGEGKERQEAEELLDIELYQQAKKDFSENIFLDPPDPSQCFGEYELGTVEYPPGKNYCSFGLKEDEWIKHLLICGMTGAGKTTFAFNLLKQFKKFEKPFLIFDWKKNYRDLLQLPEFKNLKVFTVAKPSSPFFFNPLIPPPGCSCGEWLMKLVDVIKHAYFVGEGVEYLLRDAIDWVYDKCGVLDGSNTNIPTFYQVKEYVAKKTAMGRMGLWKASTLRVLESLCFKHGLGSVVNHRKEWDHKKLLNADVVLELDALSDVDKIFLTESLILWLYEFRKLHGKRETFKHTLILEEGHHVLSLSKEHAQGAETIMETCLRQIREFGQSIIILDQEPSKLSNSIKANTFTKITFNLGNGKDLLEISNCMGLNKEESEYINLLDVGQAIVAIKRKGVFMPLHVSFPKVELQKGLIGDEDLVGMKT